MNGVIGMTGLLLDTELSPQQRRYAESVRASGESLLSIINDILDFSKIEAGKLDLEVMDFDLFSTLDDFADVVAMRAHDKGLEFICTAAPEVPSRLRGDPGRLRQVLLNLAGNAIKFTSQGEVSVTASLVSTTDSAINVRFSVRDTGIGVPADKQGMLFQKFTQVDASVTREFGGTGLGLAISKQLAHLMGGEIGVTSAPGQGSEFWFTAAFTHPVIPRAEFLPPSSLQQTHMLVVDDNASSRNVLTAMLRGWGVRVEEAADGAAALQTLARAMEVGDPFHAAILDMQMPAMDGLALGRVIKSGADMQSLPLFLLTSLVQPGEYSAFADAGFAACMPKPARCRDLSKALDAAISGRSPVSQSADVMSPSAFEDSLSYARILIAEDNITNQQVMMGLLEKLGLRAEVAANGIEVIQALETIPYDLVLMDVHMPEMDGFEATRKIRDLQSSVLDHHVPIIAMTALALQGDREKCLSAGMDDYVTKPVQVSALVAALETWLPPKGGNGQKLKGAPKAATYAAGMALPAFDRSALLHTVMDDEKFAREVVAIFLGDLPKQLAELKSFVAEGNSNLVMQQAHKIRGASATMGGAALSALAAEMEQASDRGDLNSVSARMPELDMQFEALREAMRREF